MNISRKVGHFATSESQVAIFVPEISPKIQKCRNPKSENSYFLKIGKAPTQGPSDSLKLMRLSNVKLISPDNS